jgi:hypothetical protein
VRVRAALLPSAPQPEKIKSHDWQKVFSELSWHKVRSNRASAILVVPTGNHFWQYDPLREKAAMAAASIVAFLVEKLGSVTDDTDAIKFLADN